MAEEHGYRRSGKKCREKFENLYKYYKKTREGKAGRRQDGKTTDFSDNSKPFTVLKPPINQLQLQLQLQSQKPITTFPKGRTFFFRLQTTLIFTKKTRNRKQVIIRALVSSIYPNSKLHRPKTMTSTTTTFQPLLLIRRTDHHGKRR